MSRATAPDGRARGLLAGVGILTLILAGLAFAAKASIDARPPLESVILGSAQVPAGFVENPGLSGPLDARRLTTLGVNASAQQRVPDDGTMWVRDWSTSDARQEIMILAIGAPNRLDATDALRGLVDGLAARGYERYGVHGSSGGTGFLGAVTVAGELADIARVAFQRGPLVFSVAVRTPAGPGATTAISTADDIASRQAGAGAPYGGAAVFDPVPAAEVTLGAPLGYFGAVGMWAFWRDPLRRRRRLRRRDGRSRPALPAPSGGLGDVVDVTTYARGVKRRALVFFWIQLAAASLVVDAVLPVSPRARLIFLVVGVLVSAAAARFGAGGRYTAPSGSRPWRAGALLVVAAVAALAAGVFVAGAAIAPEDTSVYRDYACAAAALAAAAGIARRRARRLSAVSARALLERDPRPPVLYLRSFQDDTLRLRSATVGRRSLVERFSPSRFDSFEEVLVRHLSAIGPVVAVNPPGTTLAPLGAARETITQQPWQSVVGDWMDHAALVVIGAPPETLTAGLEWELRQITARDRWARTLILTPPLPDGTLRTRWHLCAQAGPRRWPFRFELPADPGRVLAVTRRNERWLAITAERRTEWTYAAALRWVDNSLPRADRSRTGLWRYRLVAHADEEPIRDDRC